MSDLSAFPDPQLSQIGYDDIAQQRLSRYAELLTRWNQTYNLVGKTTLADMARRHILDSAQLLPYVKPQATWMDMGTGAGLPGLVLAIGRPNTMHLVESIDKKCQFLAHVVTELKLDHVRIWSQRLESLPADVKADVATARALAPWPQLMAWAQPHLKADGRGLFLKGRHWSQENPDQEVLDSFSITTYPSITEKGAVILEVAPRSPETTN